MPIVTPTYAALKAALDAHLFHTRLAGRYDEAVHLFETAANRRLRVRQMESGSIRIATNGVTTLPADYLLWRSVQLNTAFVAGEPPPDRGELPPDRAPPDGVPAVIGSLRELDYVHPAYAERATYGDPLVFTIQAGSLYVRPAVDICEVWLLYYQKIPTILGNDANQNWLLTEHPDAYVSGVLAELHVLGRNNEQAQLQKARRDEIFAEIIQLSALTTGATSPMMRESIYF